MRAISRKAAVAVALASLALWGTVSARPPTHPATRGRFPGSDVVSTRNATPAEEAVKHEYSVECRNTQMNADAKRAQRTVVDEAPALNRSILTSAAAYGTEMLFLSELIAKGLYWLKPMSVTPRSVSRGTLGQRQSRDFYRSRDQQADRSTALPEGLTGRFSYRRCDDYERASPAGNSARGRRSFGGALSIRPDFEPQPTVDGTDMPTTNLNDGGSDGDAGPEIHSPDIDQDPHSTRLKSDLETSGFTDMQDGIDAAAGGNRDTTAVGLEGGTGLGSSSGSVDGPKVQTPDNASRTRPVADDAIDPGEGSNNELDLFESSDGSPGVQQPDIADGTTSDNLRLKRTSRQVNGSARR